MRAATLLQVLQCSTCFKFYCTFYFTRDRSFHVMFVENGTVKLPKRSVLLSQLLRPFSNAGNSVRFNVFAKALLYRSAKKTDDNHTRDMGRSGVEDGCRTVHRLNRKRKSEGVGRCSERNSGLLLHCTLPTRRSAQWPIDSTVAVHHAPPVCDAHIKGREISEGHVPEIRFLHSSVHHHRNTG